MPPVFGPVSPSPMRLKSCAGSSGTTVAPSVTQNSDTSGPSRNSSIDDPLAGGGVRQRRVAVGGHDARPCRRRGRRPSRRTAGRTRPARPRPRPAVVHTRAARGRHAGRGHHVLGEGLAALELRGRGGRPEAGDARGADRVGDAGDERRLGPDHDEVGADVAGERRDRGAGRSASTPRCSATAAVPALPGAQTSAVTAGSAASARHSACSRAPQPMTSTRTGATLPSAAGRSQDVATTASPASVGTQHVLARTAPGSRSGWSRRPRPTRATSPVSGSSAYSTPVRRVQRPHPPAADDRRAGDRRRRVPAARSCARWRRCAPRARRRCTARRRCADHRGAAEGRHSAPSSPGRRCRRAALRRSTYAVPLLAGLKTHCADERRALRAEVLVGVVVGRPGRRRERVDAAAPTCSARAPSRCSRTGRRRPTRRCRPRRTASPPSRPPGPGGVQMPASRGGRHGVARSALPVPSSGHADDAALVVAAVAGQAAERHPDRGRRRWSARRVPASRPGRPRAGRGSCASATAPVRSVERDQLRAAAVPPNSAAT